MGVTQEELLTELQRLAEELGKTPTIDEMDAHGEYTGATYYNHFESWNAALREADLELNNPYTIRREALIEDLQRINELIEDPYPTTEAIREHGTYSLTTYYAEFGRLEAALDAAGIEKVTDTPVSTETLLEELHRLASDGSPPTTSEMDEEGAFSARTYIDRFGSWNEALEAAGYAPHLDIVEASTEDLLDEITRLHEDLGRVPTTRDMQEHGEYTASRYFSTFESWNAAVEEAGLPPHERWTTPDALRIPASELLNELQRVADIVDGRPTTEDMNEDGKYGTKPYYNRFGSWNRAVELAGFEPFTGTSEDIYSTEELIAELQRLAEERGRPPTTDDMWKHGRMSTQPFVNRFGSWIAALREAGLEPTERQLRPHSGA